jgi:hypothetical protein
MRFCLLKTVFVVAGLAAGMTARPVDAGVKGGFFQGQFTSNLEATATCTISFHNDLSLTFTQDFGSGPEAYQGTYTEQNLAIVSSWQGTIPRGDPGSSTNISGVCLLGLFTTFHLASSDGNLTATGFLVHTGSAK